MEPRRFDRLTRLFAAPADRRRALRALAGAALGALAGTAAPEEPQAQQACRAAKKRCFRSRQCCPGMSCLGGRCACKDIAFKACGKSCVDLQVDSTNCGACGTVCEGDLLCGNSKCRCLDPALEQCGTSCVDLTSDPDNCGACGTECPGNLLCLDASCGCIDELSRCGDTCTDTLTDPANCGACGVACKEWEVCSAGRCGCENAGWTVCGGACVDLKTDTSNCGSCGVTCPNGAICSAGACLCPPPTATLCAGVGCVDTAVNLNHCGRCYHACLGMLTCLSGKCTCPEVMCYVFSWSTPPGTAAPFIDPVGVVIDNTRNAYVVDRGRNTVVRFSLDGSSNGTTFGAGLSNPNYIARSATGNFYIADTGNSRIVKVTADLMTQTDFAPAVTLVAPMGVFAVGDNYLYVTDAGTNEVIKIDLASGAEMWRRGGTGNANGKFNLPIGVTADDIGNAYVTDSGNGRFQVLRASDGQFLSTFGTIGTGPGQYIDPTGVWWTSAGLYIADTGNKRMQQVSPTGAAIYQWNMVAGSATLLQPSGVAAGPDGRIVVTDVQLNQAIEYLPQGINLGGRRADGDGDDRTREGRRGR